MGQQQQQDPNAAPNSTQQSNPSPQSANTPTGGAGGTGFSSVGHQILNYLGQGMHALGYAMLTPQEQMGYKANQIEQLKAQTSQEQGQRALDISQMREDTAQRTLQEQMKNNAILTSRPFAVGEGGYAIPGEPGEPVHPLPMTPYQQELLGTRQNVAAIGAEGKNPLLAPIYDAKGNVTGVRWITSDEAQNNPAAQASLNQSTGRAAQAQGAANLSNAKAEAITGTPETTKTLVDKGVDLYNNDPGDYQRFIRGTGLQGSMIDKAVMSDPRTKGGAATAQTEINLAGQRASATGGAGAGAKESVKATVGEVNTAADLNTMAQTLNRYKSSDNLNQPDSQALAAAYARVLGFNTGNQNADITSAMQASGNSPMGQALRDIVNGKTISQQAALAIYQAAYTTHRSQAQAAQTIRQVYPGGSGNIPAQAPGASGGSPTSWSIDH